MSNPLPGRFFQGPIVDPKTGQPTEMFLKWLQYLEGKTPNLDQIGVVTAKGADFTRSYTNKNTDNVPDGSYSLRSYQQGSSALVVDNAGFEMSTTVPVPGWSLGTASAWAIDAGNPQAGKNSLKLSFTAQFQSAKSVRTYFVRPNDTFRISGWVRSDGTAQAYIQLGLFDKNGVLLAIAATTPSTNVAWTFVQATIIAPALTVSASIYLSTNSAAATQSAWYDSLQVSRTLTSFEVTPINTAGTPNSVTGLCVQHGAGLTQIDVSSSTWQFGDGTVAYNSGSVDPGSLGTWYVYADDPGYSGGSVTYVATATPSTCNAANGRVFYGKIITAAGTATSTGGGTGGGGPVSKSALA